MSNPNLPSKQFSEPVGRAKGQGEATYEFKFITPSKDKIKIGEYVYYNWINTVDNKIYPVLSRVSLITPYRVYPNEMLANPKLDPSLVSHKINYTGDGMEIYEINAQVIGYYVEEGPNNKLSKLFINPRSPPTPGAPIYLATKENLAKWLNIKSENERGAAHIGYLLNRPMENVPVVLDIYKFAATHLAVLAATGSGKSYTVGVLLEEMMKPQNKAAVLVIDPHGEYNTFAEAETNAFFINDAEGYKPVVQRLDKSSVKIKITELSTPEFFQILENLSDKMQYLLSEALSTLRSAPFTVEDLIAEVQKHPGDDSTKNGLLWRIRQYIQNKSLISNNEHMSLTRLLKPGQLTILDMSSMEQKEQQISTQVLLNRIFRSRVRVKTGKAKPEEASENLTYPVFIVLEEGHRFAPANEESSSKRILRTILSEGRKFGIGVCIISQRPGKLDPDVLSQCMTQIIMKMINPLDQQNIKASLESVSADLMGELPGLSRGQAVIAGESLLTPTLVQIKKRVLTHGGITSETVDEWNDAWVSGDKDKLKVDSGNTSRTIDNPDGDLF